MVLKTGTYTDGQGNEKGRYQRVGVLMQGNDGGFFALIDPGINFAAYKEQGHDSVMVSVYPDQQQPGQQPQAHQGGSYGHPNAPQGQGDAPPPPSHQPQW